jgi:hypothetical protein
MDDGIETYELLASDALSWLEQARGLRLSAEVMYGALQEVMPLSQTLPGIREKKLAYMQSFMLLAAAAFENLLKGIAVAKNPGGWKTLQEDSGHGISEFASAVMPLSDAESNLLRRLQEYLVWAGRYTIAKTPTRYASGRQLRVLRSTDFSLIWGLFDRLSEVLSANVTKTSNLALQPTREHFGVR